MQVHEIYISYNFQVNEGLKDICVLFNCAYYNHNISKKLCNFFKNTILTNQFQTFCIQITTNLIEALMVSYLYL
jgi:hypothetical protein